MNNVKCIQLYTRIDKKFLENPKNNEMLTRILKDFTKSDSLIAEGGYNKIYEYSMPDFCENNGQRIIIRIGTDIDENQFIEETNLTLEMAEQGIGVPIYNIGILNDSNSTSKKKTFLTVQPMLISLDKLDKSTFLENMETITNQIDEQFTRLANLNIIHHDIKLSNILFDEVNKKIFIIDFDPKFIEYVLPSVNKKYIVLYMKLLVNIHFSSFSFLTKLENNNIIFFQKDFIELAKNERDLISFMKTCLFDIQNEDNISNDCLYESFDNPDENVEIKQFYDSDSDKAEYFLVIWLSIIAYAAGKKCYYNKKALTGEYMDSVYIIYNSIIHEGIDSIIHEGIDSIIHEGIDKSTIHKITDDVDNDGEVKAPTIEQNQTHFGVSEIDYGVSDIDMDLPSNPALASFDEDPSEDDSRIYAVVPNKGYEVKECIKEYEYPFWIKKRDNYKNYNLDKMFPNGMVKRGCHKAKGTSWCPVTKDYNYTDYSDDQWGYCIPSRFKDISFNKKEMEEKSKLYYNENKEKISKSPKHRIKY